MDHTDKHNGKTKNSPKELAPDQKAQNALEVLDSLILMAGLWEDPAGMAFVKFLKWMAKGDKKNVSKGLKRYGQLWKEVQLTRQNRSPVGDRLQDHWLEKLLEDPNPFHRRAESTPLSGLPGSLRKAYQREIGLVRGLLLVDWEAEFKKAVRGSELGDIPSFAESEDPGNPTLLPREDIKRKLLSDALTPVDLAAEIARYFYANGWGPFGRFKAFRWRPSRVGRSRLEGVEAVDPIRLIDLVGYDEARQPLIENIEGLVSGGPANNVLIYGERGTGKSSTVKALLNAYAPQGLRLVEIHPDDLMDYPDVLKLLRDRREKFILFVDDLSFEENEVSYKALKALLEGTVEAPAKNVIVIATSNRRHLVREFFADREEGQREDGEVHGQDTVEEKLSLSDRFGLVVSFYSPNQDTYLQIVESWAQAEGLEIPPDQLRAEALRWSLQNNGRSGRTARQFINHLAGKARNLRGR